ncbi:hypothetical protein Tel_14045 [Candidatus Tenderia electrophaga]|uniref:Uncharacterized protein n=1 Tax=Candidatus Tenderia electrophaga TaxID=1748243 RepID=A0A0S2TG82_9GAMM|nr:hypothetical protein Tel_14045 [Candidatus Tenderia electrophaga]
MEGYAFGFSEIVGVKNGISYLAPSRTLKFEAGFIDDNKTFTDENSEVTISIEYDSEQKRI